MSHVGVVTPAYPAYRQASANHENPPLPPFSEGEMGVIQTKLCS